jgi:hypothetical protein
MSKMGSHDPFRHLKHKLWPKERPGVKLVVWLSTTKSQKSTQFTCVQVACNILLESFRRGYNFALEFNSIRGLHMKLWAPKVVEVPTLAISRLSLGSPGSKCHLDVGLMERHLVYYKGEGGGFPQVWAMVSLVNLSCPWLVLAPKVFQLCTNHLVLVLCKPVWVNEACWFFLVPSRSSNMPLYPSKVLRTKEHAPTPCYSFVFCLGLTFESLKELGVGLPLQALSATSLVFHSVFFERFCVLGLRSQVCDWIVVIENWNRTNGLSRRRRRRRSKGSRTVGRVAEQARRYRGSKRRC